jgi:hypothetical protein
MTWMGSCENRNWIIGGVLVENIFLPRSSSLFYLLTFVSTKIVLIYYATIVIL